MERRDKGMDYINTAKEILSGIGGFENVLDISHCFTRLRFRLIDEGKVKENLMKSIPGVLGVVKTGLQYQIVLGPEAYNVYHQLKNSSFSSDNHQERENRKDRNASLDVNTNISGLAEKKPEVNISVFSPISGKVKPLSEVNDPAFASEILGKGIAILPEDGKVYAPFDGAVITICSTLHAICLISDQGVELLIHIGLNTVGLNGLYFTAYVKPGDKVKKGELMLEYDLVRIKELGYDTVVPIVITNSDNYEEVNSTINHRISKGDKIIEIINEKEISNS